MVILSRTSVSAAVTENELTSHEHRDQSERRILQPCGVHWAERGKDRYLTLIQMMTLHVHLVLLTCSSGHSSRRSRDPRERRNLERPARSETASGPASEWLYDCKGRHSAWSGIRDGRIWGWNWHAWRKLSFKGWLYNDFTADIKI